MRETTRDLVQKPPSTSSWLNIEEAGLTSGVVKTGPSSFPESSQYFCGRKFIQPKIQDITVLKFRRPGSSLTGASSNTLFPNRADNAWAVGASTDDVSTLSTLGEMVWTMGSTVDALSPRMIRTSWRFWPWRLPHRRRALRRCQPTADQAGKPDSSKYQTRPFSFPKDNRSSRAATQAIDVKIGGCSDFRGRIRKGRRAKLQPMTTKRRLMRRRV
jgi:hypothetical protein